DPSGTARVVEYTGAHYKIATRSSQDGLLVVTVPEFPGWMAAVDSHPTGVMRANYALMGIGIPAGEHAVTLDFVLPGFRLGAVLRLFGLLGETSAAIWARRDRRELEYAIVHGVERRRTVNRHRTPCTL